jgi:hypothetical protein
LDEQRTKAEFAMIPHFCRSGQIPRFVLVMALLSGLVANCAWGDDAPLVISGKLTSTHDRLAPDPLRNIVIERSFSFTLSGRNNVEEHWTSHVVSNERNPRPGIASTMGAHESALGEEGNAISWRVLGPHQIRRISQGKQFVAVMTLSFNEASRTCKLSAEYFLEKGKSFIIRRRADTGEFANFSLDKVLNTSCVVSGGRQPT